MNNTGYQMMRPELVAPCGRRDTRSARIPRAEPVRLPPLLHPDPQRYLIVGAGAGNDVAGGCATASQRTVAVEIDPAIIDSGRRYHPERP